MRAATLFDADAASYSGTVEVIGVIYKAEDDGYAVLEVQETETGEGFALVGPVAHLESGDRAEVSGDWQTRSASSAPCAGSAAIRRRRPPSPGSPVGRSATSTSSSPPTASPTWRRRSMPAT